ncbi:glycosyltransferase family 4 protein [candidate division KSB1 bacterium]|nr:glycosyltransferase family 4 protein [candidate division KSB1 bacterium]NIR71250.1 glycosyltransferase family 4 protein [candidate division KSB1 bacterium]NIS26191.1 glycosyltransferase family 4 protein [candidate division KSB1 bacterium]NIT72969.1 glycosyltransferase family 4 protein [candidate division KSB1 bacterium]NIU26838.1 glycosyltransferase family 4 protein [candidate division KSB1 bacterium]
MARKKVLIIAYAFPPAGGGGVQRPTKFVKYLRDFDWEPIVLTATEDSFVDVDTDLLKDIPDDIVIERVRPYLSQRTTFNFKKKLAAHGKSSKLSKRTFANLFRDWFLIPDSQVLWVIPAAARLRKMLNHHNPDLIFATAPPYSALLLGLFAKKVSKGPLIVDFRDPWSQYLFSFRSRENRFRKSIEKHLEHKVVKGADSVIAVTQDMVSYFKSNFSLNSHDSLDLIYNGFDEDDFQNVVPKRFEKFTILYTGKVLPNLTSAVPFVKGFKKFLENNPELRERVQVKFMGLFDDAEAKNLIDLWDLEDTIIIDGYLQHSECISSQFGADLLLLLLNADTPQPVTGKVFEYLRAGKPILALIPQKGLAADVLKKANAGIIISPDDSDKIAAELQAHCLGQRKNDNCAYKIDAFNRRQQTGELASIFNQMHQFKKQ